MAAPRKSAPARTRLGLHVTPSGSAPFGESWTTTPETSRAAEALLSAWSGSAPRLSSVEAEPEEFYLQVEVRLPGGVVQAALYDTGAFLSLDAASGQDAPAWELLDRALTCLDEEFLWFTPERSQVDVHLVKSSLTS